MNKETIEPIKQKLDEKIKALNSSRVYKKVTPKGDLSWYVKWTASIIMIMGMVMTAVEFTPLNLFFHLAGVTGWFVVGWMWHDRALMTVNSIAMFIFAVGILLNF